MEKLGYAVSFSSPLHGKRRVLERRKPVLMDQLQPSINSDKLSEEHNRADTQPNTKNQGCVEQLSLVQESIAEPHGQQVIPEREQRGADSA